MPTTHQTTVHNELTRIGLRHWRNGTITIDLPKVIWGEGRVAVLSHTHAVKSPMVTMVRSKLAPKSTPCCGPIRKPHYQPHPWTRPTYDAKRHPDPIRRSATMYWTDRPTHVRTDGPTDRPRESWTTIGRCATRATRPNNGSASNAIGPMGESALSSKLQSLGTWVTTPTYTQL